MGTPSMGGWARTRRDLVLCVALLGAALHMPMAAEAQQADTVIVPSELACPDCRIALGDPVDFVGPHPPGAIGYPLQVIGVDGTWLVVYHILTDEVHRYGPDGHYQGRLGRTGGGPGEFRRIGYMVAVPDSPVVDVFDYGNARLTRWDVRGDRPLATFSSLARRPHSVVRTADGDFIVSAIHRDPDRAAYRLFRYGQDGSYHGPIGPRTVFRSDRFRHAIRALSIDPDDGLWAGHFLEYVIDRFAPDGTLAGTFVRDAAFFRPQDRTYAITEDLGPPTSLAEIAIDRHGLLWTAVNVPDPAWSMNVSDARVIEGRSTIAPENLSKVWDTVIEVIDPDRGVVLARTRLDGLIVSWSMKARPPWAAVAQQSPQTGVVEVSTTPLMLINRPPQTPDSEED